MPNQLTLFSNQYQIIDSLEYVTLADSFVKNKIGAGHGEAKLYVGNQSEKLYDFFEDFNGLGFFCKKDFNKFLEDAKSEFLNPQQVYVNKNMSNRYNVIKNKLNNFNDNEMLSFHLFHSDVQPPRVYISSDSNYYLYMREIGLPNISYLSILKLKDKAGNFLYYFKVFIDYKSDITNYLMPGEEIEIKKIEVANFPLKLKQTLVSSRIGQGVYRNKLLEQCPFCPFTMVNDERLLIASHIKPWAKSNDSEKIDPENGFMFTPTYDKLFDRGFISFSDDRTLIVSPWLSPMNQKRLNIYNGKKIPLLPLTPKRIEYLVFHQNNIFKD